MAASFVKQSSNAKSRKKGAEGQARRFPSRAEIAGGGRFCLAGSKGRGAATAEASDPPD
jgi:hypothetical protein